ncbi:MAG: outer membrane beta-barrel protein [Terriglobia bacterium]
MNARKMMKVLAAALLLCLSAVALEAQDFNVFVMGGGSSLFDRHNFVVKSGPFGSTYSTGGQFTVGAQVPLVSIVSLEGAYGWGQNNLRLTNFGDNIETGYGVHNQRASGDLVLHSPVGFLGLKPYLDAGLEYDRFTPYGFATSSFPNFSQTVITTGSPVLSPSNKLGFNYGGGLEWKLLPVVGLRLDVRDHVTGAPTFGLPEQASSSPFFPEKGAAHDLEYSVGIVLHFGK